MIQKNCFFYIDSSLKQEEQKIQSICVDCYNNKHKNKKCWFWNGEKLGYGPWQINCDYCNSVIHEYSERLSD